MVPQGNCRTIWCTTIRSLVMGKLSWSIRNLNGWLWNFSHVSVQEHTMCIKLWRWLWGQWLLDYRVAFHCLPFTLSRMPRMVRSAEISPVLTPTPRKWGVIFKSSFECVRYSLATASQWSCNAPTIILCIFMALWTNHGRVWQMTTNCLLTISAGRSAPQATVLSSIWCNRYIIHQTLLYKTSLATQPLKAMNRPRSYCWKGFLCVVRLCRGWVD